jgi:hypothetical protein
VFKAFFFFQICSGIAAQNRSFQRFDSEGINTVRIDGDQIFKIHIETHKLSCIDMASVIDGAYIDQYQIVGRPVRDALNIQMLSNPLDAVPDDKRNAHKVVAAELNIKLPEGFNLQLSSDIASVKVKGSYRTVAIELFQGFCEIFGLAKEVMVNTVDGNIYVETLNADVNAESVNGLVSEDIFTTKQSYWNLRSLHGTIEVINQNQKH